MGEHLSPRVLFVLPRMVVGGIERMRLKLIRSFTKGGIECSLALRRRDGPLVDEAQSMGPVDELAPRGMHQFLPALVRVIANRRPTHVITAFADVAFLTGAALRIARSRAIWIHSVHLTHERVARRPGAIWSARAAVERLLARAVYRHADRIITVSNALRDEVLRFYGIPPHRVVTIYNPVVPDALLATPAPHTNNLAARIVSIGRLEREKGYDVLIQAMQRVPGQWHLDIWGDGSERGALAALVDRLELGGKIELRGYTNDPFKVMREAGTFVLPSRAEGFGNVLVEALACQCQVVSTDCPAGPSEVLEMGKLGQIVPPDDIDALAAAIANVMNGVFRVDKSRLLRRAADFSESESYARWKSIIMD